MLQSVHVKLAAHPANPARFHQQIDVRLDRPHAGPMEITYVVHGLNLDLRVPSPHFPAPADALWRTTCCELFVGSPAHPGYREFNFSPSRQWAVFDFSDTRQRHPESPACAAPDIRTRRTEDLLQIDVSLPAAALPAHDALCLALSVILEAEGGSLGYWALAHPPGAPDFHHPAGFALSLGPAGFRPSRWP